MRSPKSACTYLLFLVTLSVFLGQGEMTKRQNKIRLCFPCGNGCKKCRYGSSYSDFCHERVCNKGPGERCGGDRDRLGICPEGMYCQCNKCSGCTDADNPECFESETCNDIGRRVTLAPGEPDPDDDSSEK